MNINTILKKFTSCIIAATIALLVSGCNNDIFVENADLPDYTDISIEGDGGLWSSAFSRKGLVSISIDDYASNVKNYFTYYGVNGDIVDADCPPSELGSIVYENPLQSYSIGFNGDMIYITSNYNATFYNHISLRLHYDYGAIKYINVTFTEGEALSLVGWELSGDILLEENFEQVTHSSSFTNNTPLAQKFEIMPFLNSKCSDTVIPTDSWARGLTLKLPMLTFNGNYWEWREYDDIRLGERRNFSPGWCTQQKLTMDVPAYTKATVTYTLHYTRATQSGCLIFQNPTVQQSFNEDVTWTSIYATSFDYKVKYE